MDRHGLSRLLQHDQDSGKIEQHNQRLADDVHSMINVSTVCQVAIQFLHSLKPLGRAAQAEGMDLPVENLRQDMGYLSNRQFRFGGTYRSERLFRLDDRRV